MWKREIYEVKQFLESKIRASNAVLDNENEHPDVLSYAKGFKNALVLTIAYLDD